MIDVSVLKESLAELTGTFALVFVGCGAIWINDITGGAITHVGVSLTFGLVVMVVIFAVGEFSGDHFNPAVILGFYFAGRMLRKPVLP